MYYFYILKSKKTDGLYFGYTADLRKRIQQHNSNQSKATKLKGPFLLLYYEAYLSQADAKHREYSVKLRGNAYGQLKLRIKNCVAEAE